MKKDKKDKIDLSKYNDLSGVSLKDMHFGLWLSKNRKLFTRMIIVFLIAASAFFFIYSSYNYVVYFLTGKSNEELLETGNLIFSRRKITDDMTVSKVRILKSSQNYDLAVKLGNPNEKFMANFEYCFKQQEEKVSCDSGFILPNEEKYILALNKELPSAASDIQFVIEDLFWQRINTHQIPDWNQFRSERFNFLVENLHFASASESGLSERLSLNALEFNISNKSPYNYYEVPLSILLYNGAELVGVNRYITQDFLAGEKLDIRIAWSENLPIISRAEVVPEINILDSTIYLDYQDEDRN